MVEFFDYIPHLVIVVTAIASILLGFNYLALNTLMQKVVIYIFVGCLFEIASFSYIKIFHANNLFFFHGFAMFEVWILSVFFFEFYKKHGIFIQKNYVLLPALGFLIINSLFIQPITTFNSNGLIVVGVVTIAYCIYAFYLMLEKEISFLFYQEVKWFIIAIFLAHSSIFIFELFSNQIILLLEKNQQQFVWRMRSALLLFTRLIFLYIAIKSFRLKKDGKY